MGLPEPYYQDESVTLYHGDCRMIVPLLQGVDAVITDPPYGMAYKPLRGSDGGKKWTDGVVGDFEKFDPSSLVNYPFVCLWGANWYADALPAHGGWIVWDKTPRGRKEGFFASDAELAWTNLDCRVRKFSLQWGGEARNGEPNLHPTQKPVALMRWLLDEFTKPGDTVLDPYMGSGPLARAAKDIGRNYIGIEIERKHLDVAIDRCRQEVLF